MRDMGISEDDINGKFSFVIKLFWSDSLNSNCETCYKRSAPTQVLMVLNTGNMLKMEVGN